MVDSDCHSSLHTSLLLPPTRAYRGEPTAPLQSIPCCSTVMLRTAIIGGYRIGDSDSESHSSTHSTYDRPSSFVEFTMSELPLPTPPISVIDPNDHLWIMEEELTRNQLKTDTIEAALQNILAKLDTLRVKENVVYEEPSSGRVELVEEVENYGGKAE
jgi:hypothetical protein